MTMQFEAYQDPLDDAVITVKVYDRTAAGKVYIATNSLDKSDLGDTEPDNTAVTLEAAHSVFVDALA